jgi:outer membrane biosynthesis protein TonB
VAPSLFTRAGVVISAGIHGGAVLLAVLFTGANPFDSVATEAIAVDIISPSEAPPEPDWSVPSDTPVKPSKPQFDVAALTPPPMPTPPQSQPEPQPEAKPAEAAKQQRREAPRNETSASSPVKGQEFGTAPPAPSQAPPPPRKGAATETGVSADQVTEKQADVGNMFGMPLTLPDGRLGGAFDSPSSETAKIERSSIEAFRNRIKSCAILPAGVSPSDRVSLVIRIALKRDGTLAGQPTLIEASASPKGPALMQSLFAALAKCQPFNMLPADRYQEWQSLDIRFTPQDLGQG